MKSLTWKVWNSLCESSFWLISPNIRSAGKKTKKKKKVTFNRKLSVKKKVIQESIL